MKKNIIIILVAMVIILGLFFVIFISKSIFIEKPPLKNRILSVSTSTSVASGWSTYVNNDKGFSIDYPKNFIVKENIIGTSTVQSVNFGDKETIGLGDGELSVFGPADYSSFDAYFKDIQDPYQIDKKGMIDGNEAEFFSFTFSNEDKYEKRVVIKHDNEFWTITTYSFNEDYKKITDNLVPSVALNLLSEDDYNRVISSFKFLK
jgi:hypothetical protein